MATIKSITAREILNCLGNPTIETTVLLSDGTTGTASCPSGTSVSSYEAVELHDTDQNRFHGLGVLKAIANIEKIIAPKLISMEATKQTDIDKAMIALDGTENKSTLGANAILSTSMAVAKAAALSLKLPLYEYLNDFLAEKNAITKIPIPIFNIINGGKHAPEGPDIQEFILVPASTKTYSESLLLVNNIYESLKNILQVNNYSTLVGAEGGFAPKLSSNANAFTLLQQAIEATHSRLGYDVFLGIDSAATTFYKNAHYSIREKGSLPAKQLIQYYEELVNEFHIIYLEDILAEDDWEGWVEANAQLAENAMVVGDDVISTNPYRLQMALDKNAVNGVIIKPNQIGTVTEAMAIVEVARIAGLKIIVSHRSGETNDDFIADFGVAVNADYVKFGAPVRGERVAKYNRLLEIEKELAKK